MELNTQHLPDAVEHEIRRLVCLTSHHANYLPLRTDPETLALELHYAVNNIFRLLNEKQEFPVKP